MKKKLLLILFVGLFLNVHTNNARAAFATEATQLLNNIQLILSYVEMLKEVEQSYRQLQNQIIDLQKLNYVTLNADNAIGLARTLDMVIRKGQALAYNASNIDEEFRRRFKDYDYYVQEIGGVENDRYQKWAVQNLDNVRSVLANVNFNHAHFENDAEWLKHIESQVQTASGRDQILQAGNEAAGFIAAGILNLREMLAADIQLQANYQASLIDKQAKADAHQAKADSGNIEDNLTDKRKIYSTSEGLFGSTRKK